MAGSYRKGVDWIAWNDEPTDMDPESVAEMISVDLLAYVFGKEPLDVGKAVVRKRVKLAKEEGW